MDDDAPPAAPQTGATERREQMPAWLPRAIVLAIAAWAAFEAGGWLLSTLRGLIVMLLISLFLSFAIEPAVNVLARRGWRRGAATGFVFLVLLGASTVFVVAIGSLVVDQVEQFVDEAPDYIEDIERWINDRFDREFEFDDLVAEFTDEQGAAREFVNDLASNAILFGFAALGVLFQIFAIALFTFYLVADGPKLRRAILSRLRPDRQLHVLRIWELAIEKTGAYLYSRTLLALLSGIAHWIALTIIGVPFPLALALWVGVVSQFVPTIGTYIAGALAVGVAGLNEPADALWTLAFVVVYQQIENYLLAPRVTAHTMEIHPAVAFGAVIAGAALLGIAGALLALPAAAVLQAFISTIGERHEVVDSALTAEPRRRGGRQAPPEPPPDPPPPPA
jgi:predicted PurR-regulated permease PerM